MAHSAKELPDGHGSVYKEVRFSPTATPIRRTKSVSGTAPSAKTKNYRTQSSCVPERTPIILDSSYIDQSRALLDRQRAHFEEERKLFAEERRLWQKERTLLRTKITELESLLKVQQGLPISPDSAKPAFGSPSYLGTNESTIHSAQVWEGSSPGGRPTRVFRDEDAIDPAHVSPISERSSSIPPSLDAALSPQAGVADAESVAVSVPVPIEKLDSRLDGIILKSTALPPGVVARVITPPSPSPLETSSAAPSAAARSDQEHRNSLKLKLSELGPPGENLVRNAGHTPMAIIEADVSQRSTKEPSPIEEMEEPPCDDEEAPLAPVATTVQQPTENGISYFPDLPEDPALQGPLGLINDEEHDNSFLSELDQKLLDQARRILSPASDSGKIDEDEGDAELPTKGDQEPEIKFRKSTNFGTAFGISSYGNF